MSSYADLHDLEEDDRIAIIGLAAMTHVVSFVTDDTPFKADRYKRKLLARFPTIEIIDTRDGPVGGTLTVRVGPKKESLT